MIPKWNNVGNLPPILPGEAGTSPHRSPYRVSLVAVIERFALSPQRIAILNGLLNYREALHQVGLTRGFQWLNGSFMQDVENQKEERPPNDIDVVTFFYLPDGETGRTLASKNPQLFQNDYAKKTYHVDAFFTQMGNPFGPSDVKITSYWYSMWSHTRDNVWKGFIEVDLAPEEDVEARRILNQFQATGEET